MKKVVVLVLALSMVAHGCALMARGTTETVEVRGVGLEVDGAPEQSGPVKLRRRQVHVISAMVDGQRQTRTLESDLSAGWFAGDLAVFGVILAPIGSVAFLVDLATGALNEFETTEVSFPASTKDGSERPATCSRCGTPLGATAKFCSECGGRAAPRPSSPTDQAR
jgi:hypothetical protein